MGYRGGVPVVLDPSVPSSLPSPCELVVLGRRGMDWVRCFGARHTPGERVRPGEASRGHLSQGGADLTQLHVHPAGRTARRVLFQVPASTAGLPHRATLRLFTFRPNQNPQKTHDKHHPSTNLAIPSSPPCNPTTTIARVNPAAISPSALARAYAQPSGRPISITSPRSLVAGASERDLPPTSTPPRTPRSSPPRQTRCGTTHHGYRRIDSISIPHP